MKTIAYSEVPRKPAYVHLAYVSASVSANTALFETALLVGGLSLVAYCFERKRKPARRTARIWYFVFTISVLVAVFVGIVAALQTL